MKTTFSYESACGYGFRIADMPNVNIDALGSRIEILPNAEAVRNMPFVREYRIRTHLHPGEPVKAADWIRTGLCMAGTAPKKSVPAEALCRVFDQYETEVGTGFAGLLADILSMTMPMRFRGIGRSADESAVLFEARLPWEYNDKEATTTPVMLNICFRAALDLLCPGEDASDIFGRIEICVRC